MCGRFAQTSSPEALIKIFDLASVLPFDKRFNIAPTQPILVVREHHDGRHAHLCRWGFVPPWAKDLRIGHQMINARSESVFEKRSFAHAARHQRCVIPASGFYEWRDTPTGKMPTLFTPASQSVFHFAGLWSSWTGHDGALVYSATILTTKANRIMAPFHHRMPVLLDPTSSDTWLDSSLNEPSHLKPILQTAAPDTLHLRAVTKRVNNVRNDDPSCWEPAGSSQ